MTQKSSSDPLRQSRSTTGIIMKLEAKSVIVTGAASGIGREIALT
jgi:hypothetical protein